MDENNDQPKVIYSSPNPFYTKRIFYLIIALIILTLIEIFLLGYYGFKINIFNKSPESVSISSSSANLSGKTIKESELPMAVDILQNPMVDQWVAAVKGKLIEKIDNSITLQDNQDHTITIPTRLADDPKNDSRMWTRFYITKKGQEIPESITLDKIPIGAILSGEFFILPLPDNKNRTVGSQFVWDENVQELK